MPPRTIDNLGVDVSTRYAEDQRTQTLDQTLIKEARIIPVQTEIEVTIPFFPSELEALLHSSPLHMSWASFIAPSLYYEQRKRLFTFQSIPSLGSEDKKESQEQKIMTKLQILERQNQEKGEERDQEERRKEEIALEEEEREKKILITLLQTIAHLDKLIIDINSKRSQYHKG